MPGAGRSARILPARLIGREVRVHLVIGAELPDVAFLDEVVLVDAAHPGRVLLEVAHHREGARAQVRGLAVRRHVDDELVLHVVVQDALVEALLAIQIEVAAHRRLADVDAAQRDLDRAVLREELGERVPLERREVVAVDALQVLDLRDVLELPDFAVRAREGAGRVFGQPRGGEQDLRIAPTLCARIDRMRIVRRHHDGMFIGRSRHAGNLSVRRDRRLHARLRQRGLAPAILVRREHRRPQREAADLPRAAFAHVAVLIDAGAPLVELALLRVLREQVPAALRGAAIRCHGDDGLKLHVVVETARRGAGGADRAQVVEDPRLADPHALAHHLEGRVVAEQRGRLVPLTLVDVEAVDALQVLDLVLIVEQRRAMDQPATFDGAAAPATGVAAAPPVGSGDTRLRVPSRKWNAGTNEPGQLL